MPRSLQDKANTRSHSDNTLNPSDILDALDIADIGVWTHHIDQGAGVANDAFWKLFDAKQVNAFDFRDIVANHVHEEDQSLLLEGLQRICVPDGMSALNSSFRVVCHDHSVRYLSIQAQTEFETRDGTLVARKTTAVFRDITQQMDMDAHNRLLIRELTYRVKSTLAVVQSVAYQTFRRDVSATGLFADFQGRLRALGKAHDLLVERRFLGTFLEPLAERILGGCGAPFNRVTMDGFPLHIGSKQAVTLSIVLHELSVNSLKYGAFSVPTGRVSLSWERNEQSDMVRIRWIESDGPPVIEPQEKGFGSRMIERAVALEFGGALTMDFAPEGVRCTMTIPFKSFGQVST